MTTPIPSPPSSPAHVERIMGRCVHFTGVQHDVCHAGVRYADVRGTTTRPFGLPCIQQYANGATCSKAQWPTRDEAEAEEAQFQAAYARIRTCLKAITEKHGTARGVVDVMSCPTGCGGTLRYSIASYNGHIHGQCSTKGCATWMQ